MTIPYVEERKQLLALWKQVEEIAAEERQVVGPLTAIANAQWQAAIEEYKASGGKWPGSLKDYAAIQPYEAKCKPAQDAAREAARPFQARLDAVHAEIKRIEAVVGKIMDDPWRGEGDAVCAMTGLPILESDKVGSVIAAALPATAAINS